MAHPESKTLSLLSAEVQKKLIAQPFGAKELPSSVSYAAPQISGYDARGQDIHKALSYFGDLPGIHVPGGPILFDRLIRAPGYYLLKAEEVIVKHYVEYLRDIIGGACLVEFGPGDGTKTLEFLRSIGVKPAKYVGIDIAQGHLEVVKAKLSAFDFMPKKSIITEEADFTAPDFWDRKIWAKIEKLDMPTIGFIPGSTLGNFTPRVRAAFMARARPKLQQMLVALDSTQDRGLLAGAYGEPVAPIALQFYLNGLCYAGQLRSLDMPAKNIQHKFDYAMSYTRKTHRVKMSIVSTRRQEYPLYVAPISDVGNENDKRRTFVIGEGESIHCFDSYKPERQALRDMFRRAKWRVAERMSFRDAMENPELLGRLPFWETKLNEKIDYNIYHLM